MPVTLTAPRTRWAIAVAAAVLIAEAGYWVFQHVGWRPTDGAIYSWSTAFDHPTASDSTLAASTRLYQADRGANPTLTVDPNHRLVAFYFEWDGLKSAINSPTGGHQPEVCNTALGYEFLGVLPSRQWPTPAGPMEFESTHFLSPDGTPVYVFKNIWFRGLGNWENRKIVKPWNRLPILARHRLEEARLLSTGAFGFRSPDDAWHAFGTQVLKKLEWAE
ncbi:MAG: hypothetical protein ACKV19_25930 [Verrucomicrobiales bacterium]